MNNEIEVLIRDNCPWAKLPKNIKQILGGSKSEYEKMIVEYSVKNQLRYRGNLIRFVKKVEEQYYEMLLNYSREHLMLYPYHLSDIVVKGLRVTPFQYYLSIMQDLMSQEKSYDSLPNFTAADGLRLLEIGRNQYIDLMNQCRSMKKLFRKKPIRDILPAVPADILLQFWWIIQLGSVLEDDIKNCTKDEKFVIDYLFDNGAKPAGMFDYQTVQRLYNKGLIYFDVPIEDDDYVIIPPLNDFVMNRVSGDYFETMLYKIFVSIDDHTSVVELSNILQIDINLVKNAVSVFCRLNFAHKKNLPTNIDLHNSWSLKITTSTLVATPESSNCASLIDLTNSLIDFTPGSEIGLDITDSMDDAKSNEDLDLKSISESITLNDSKRIGFIFDSTLTAFLMMGNLSSSLKNHAVTLFEAGKLTDESLDNFVEELKKVKEFSEGEAQRYFEHATVLRETIEFLRANCELDLIRCESLMGLDPFARVRLLKKNYQILLSMAPLSNEMASINCSDPPHLGPAVAEINSPWFRLFLYNLTGDGPVTFLFVKGCRVRKLPKAFQPYKKLLLGVWSQDLIVVPADNCLLALNEALQHSVVLLQAYSTTSVDAEIVHVPFPASFSEDSTTNENGPLKFHPIVKRLSKLLTLEHNCGYVTLIRLDPSKSAVNFLEQNGFHHVTAAGGGGSSLSGTGSGADKDLRKLPSSRSIDTDSFTYSDWTLYDCVFGLPLFDRRLNKQICDNLTKHQLLNATNLTEIKDCSSKIGTMVLDFIRDFQMNLDDPMDFYGGAHAERRVPYPTHTLTFDKSGKAKLWDGS